MNRSTTPVRHTKFFTTVFLGILLFVSCNNSKQSIDPAASNFKMILRLWPEHHKDTILRDELLKAIHAYPNTFEEVWLCAEFETISMDAHRKSAAAMAVTAQKMRNLGITPSIQAITLGHGDNFESGAEELIPAEWGTITDINGVATRASHCPRQPKYHEYLEEMYALYAGCCQPAIVWLDDDLRVTHHWPARQLCFCDTCIRQFNEQYGGRWNRETLAQALDENKDKGAVREQWIAFSQESLASVARTISRSVHRVSPKTRMGLQHANFHRELLEGRDWNPIFKAMKEETGLTPASRPGNGFYNDHAPREMVMKGYDMSRQIRRLDPDIKEIAAEIEGYRHYASGKSPHGLCVESLLYLSMGATQLSYAIVCSASEPMEWYADNYFKKLQEWRPFYEEYARFNEGTEPGGLDPYISLDQVIREKIPGEISFAWITTGANDPVLSLSFLGIPFCPDGNHPSALILDTEAVNGLTKEEATYLFQHRGILLDAPAWECAQSLGLDTLLTAIPAPGELTNVSCYLSQQGGRIAVIPSFDGSISAMQRLNLLHIADWTASNRIPVIMETMAQAVIVPRVDNKGKIRSVTLLNCSISEQPETQLRLRGCDSKKNQKFVWKKAGQPDVSLHPHYDGNDAIIQIPQLEGWNIGWLAIIS